ncbi:MAG: hypothetical protein P8P91_07195, partial [Pseudomonadales bacterium]|nr:hypothetical protein [Pseudomonadales bacterium]
MSIFSYITNATLLFLALVILTTPHASAKSVGTCIMYPEDANGPILLSSGHKFSAADASDVDGGECWRGNYIQLDCNGAGMANESTANTITATVYEGDGTELWTLADTVGCDSITDHTFHFVPYLRTKNDRSMLEKGKYKSEWYLEVGDARAKGMYVVLSTNGDDAF